MAIPFALLALWLVRRFGTRLPETVSVLAGDDEPLSREERVDR